MGSGVMDDQIVPAATVFDLQVQVRRLLAERERLRAALRRWTEADGGSGLHLGGCASEDGGACDCGLDAARDVMAKGDAPP